MRAWNHWTLRRHPIRLDREAILLRAPGYPGATLVPVDLSAILMQARMSVAAEVRTWTNPPESRQAGVLIFAVLLVSSAWFYQAGGWNQNSRFDLVRAIVEKGTLQIDAYETNTGDKAESRGHIYSDKAPGLALAAVPLAFVAAPVARLLTQDEEGYVRWLSYVLTTGVAGIPVALTGVLLYWVSRRMGAGHSGSMIAALCYGLATPAWAYAALLFGHALAAFCLVAAFAAALALGDARRRDPLLSFLLGLSAGWAVITEYPSAPPALLIAIFALAQIDSGERGRRLRVLAGMAAGALIPLLVLLLYNRAAFGSELEFGYTHVQGFGGMKTGLMGVSRPHLWVLYQILFGSYRGLFYHAPILLVAAAGFVPLLRGRGIARRAGITAALIVIFYMLFNASYYYWFGGWSYGPRHMSPAIPFLALGLAPLWTGGRPLARILISATAVISLAVTLVAVSTTAQPPQMIRRPIADLCWPAFREGDLSLNHQSFLEIGADFQKLRGGSLQHDAFNLGQVLGLQGHMSLLPLLLLWALAAARLSRIRPEP